MAEVFRARAFGPLGFEKAVAIKRILPALAQSREFVDRFIAEARISVNLHHANIIQILDFSRFGESLYIVMEYVEGADLARLLKQCRAQGRRFPMGAALHVATELLSGLDYAHRKQVVHRDVSPSNVLVSRAGEVKIADFGIARAAGELAAGRTRPFQILGKWRYMSPEQTRGAKVDARSDLFSAGSVLFEVFTGERLFAGGDPAMLARQIRERPLPRASSLRPELPGGVDELLGELLERDPERRMSSASAAARRLVELSYGLSIPATPAALADLLADLDLDAPAAGAGEETGAHTGSSSSSGQLIDEILSSELARAGRGGGDRVTLHDPGPPRPPAGEVDEDPSVDGSTTALTFVQAEPDPDGISRWLVGEGGGEIATLAEEVPHRAPIEPGALDGLDDETTAIEAEPGPDRRRRVRIAWIAGGVSLLLLAAAAYFVARGESGREDNLAVTGLRAGTDAGALDARVSARLEPADAAPSRGLLSVTSDPSGAAIALDGRAWPSPTPAAIPIEAGTHTVAVTLPGRRPCRYDGVSLEDGEERTLRCELESLQADLSVETEPAGAEVLLDGHRLGVTPLNRELPSAAGKHEIVLRLDGRREERVPITLGAGEPVTVWRHLKERQRYGTIDLYVEPWAHVYIGGKKVGTAPRRGLRLPVGRHRLRLVNPVLDREATIEVEVPSRRPYRVTLKGR